MFDDFYEALSGLARGPAGRRAVASFARSWMSTVEVHLAGLEPGSWDRIQAAAEGSLVHVRLAESVEGCCAPGAIGKMYERAVSLAYESGDVQAVREALFCTGRWLHGCGRCDAAADNLRECLAQGERAADALELLARSLTATGGPAQVVLWLYDWLVTLQPSTIDHYIARAQVEQGVDPEAIKHQARHPDPGDLQSAARRIAALHARHRWKQAVRTAATALDAAEAAGDGEWVSGLRSYLARYR